ncbi:MAG: 23S rRNA (uracil(1939)-C(5))-methyltransferase RlmD [Clostridia bacterium]|nr:23S rRNA (uracil(1939)-C(5))-methyltransferase RlmD [Clostridia bacterium]
MHDDRIFEGLITSVSDDGSGITHNDGYTVFVKNACVGDKCLIEITKANKNYGFGVIKGLLTPSPHRIEPQCHSFPACGGCTLLHTDYSFQLELKRSIVRDALTRIGGFENVYVHETVPSEPSFYYRNKSQYPVGGKVGDVKIGFYSAKSHNVINNDNCLIETPDSRLVVSAVKNWMNKYKIAPYDENRHSGAVRHVYFRSAKTSIAVIVSRIANVPHLETLKAELLSLPLSAPLSGIVLNVNPNKTNTVLGKKDKILYGANYILASIGEITYKVSYRSFFQVNSFTTHLLYQKTLDLCALSKNDTVFDLYCGIGTISLFLAKHAKKVIGVEIIPSAVSDAKENAKLNNIQNASFYEGAAEEVCPDLIKKGEKADIVVVDPPRKGCAEPLLEAIAKMNPKKIVYVSCNPATLARDAKYLRTAYGYTLTEAYPFDQFPHSTHVETVCLLSKVI